MASTPTIHTHQNTNRGAAGAAGGPLTRREEIGQHRASGEPERVPAHWAVVTVSVGHHLLPFQANVTHSFARIDGLAKVPRVRNNQDHRLLNDHHWDEVMSLKVMLPSGDFCLLVTHCRRDPGRLPVHLISAGRTESSGPCSSAVVKRDNII